MTFRDDGDAARMRADALAKELAETERALEEERDLRAEAEKKLAAAEKKLAKQSRSDASAPKKAEPEEAPATKPDAPASAPPRSRRTTWLVGGIAASGLVLGAFTLAMAGPAGLDLPTEPTPERAVPGCSCTLDDGRVVTLGLAVAGASRMANAPGRPWQWYLQWTAHYGRDHMTLSGSAPSSAIWGDDDTRAYIACVGRDRLVAASYSNVTLYSLSERRVLWNRDTMNNLGTGFRGATCDTLPDVRDGVVRIPGSDSWQIRLRLADGRDAD